MVFQDPMTSLNPVFTIGDQMGTILKYADRRLGRARDRRGRMARVHEVLRQVRMPDPERIAGSYPIMLSGGMRQRVLIAMALLSEPRLLIADEPGTALDVTTQAQILKLLRDLVEERDLALLMITHNLGVVRESADYVYVMYAGSVVEHGPTAELFARPSHPYTRALIDCVPKLSGDTTFRGIDGSLPDYAAPPPGCRFSPRCGLATPVCERQPPDIAGQRRSQRGLLAYRRGGGMSEPLLEVVGLGKAFPIRGGLFGGGQGRGQGGQRRQFQAGQGRSLRARGRERVGQIDASRA